MKSSKTFPMHWANTSKIQIHFDWWVPWYQPGPVRNHQTAGPCMRMYVWWATMHRASTVSVGYHWKHFAVSERLWRCESGEAGTELPQHEKYSEYVANEVIKRIIKDKFQKDLWTENGDGEKFLVRTMTDNDEGKFVADTIQEQKLRNHFSIRIFHSLPHQCTQSRAFEEALRRMAIPYDLWRHQLLSTKGNQRSHCYLRIIINPNDEEALKRIINFPVRGIGKTSIDKSVLFANENNISMWQVLKKHMPMVTKQAPCRPSRIL